MNEKLEGALTELLSKAIEGIDAASGFLTDEIPDVVQQLLMWHGVYNLLMFAIGILLLASIPFQVKKLLKTIPDKIKDGDQDNWYWKDGTRNYNSLEFRLEQTELSIFLMIAFAVLAIVEVFISLNLINLQWLQILIAPKVWLLEYAANLAK